MLVIGGILLISAAPAPVGAPAFQESRPSWEAQLKEFEATYKLTVVTTEPEFPIQTTHGKITGAKASRRELKKYVPVFVEEFSRYPAAAVQKTGMLKIVLCRNLAFAGEKRASIPDYDHTVMYYDAARAAYSPTYQRATVHHEFFHMIDWKDDKRVYRDRGWSSLNPSSFSYGRQHVRDVDKSLWGRLDETLEGFLNRYSMTGVQEDKAEIFCYMIFKPEMMALRARTDSVLADKIDAMKELTRKFSPSMDEDFWDDLSSR